MTPTTRLMRAADRRFVAPTWVRSFASAGAWPHAATLANHWAVVDAILEAPTTRVAVLCTGDDGDALHGWAAVDTAAGALHWAYVPPELRGRGYARLAVSAALGDYPRALEITHPLAQMPTRLRLNPYPMLRAMRAALREAA